MWPPARFVDLIHWCGETYDPLLLARPPFWRMTIWIDVIFFGPFYLFAIYAFIRGRNWIRVPALVWSGHDAGQRPDHPDGRAVRRHAGQELRVVLAVNAPGCSCRSLMIWRMRRDHPFHEPSPTSSGRPRAAGRSAARGMAA